MATTPEGSLAGHLLIAAPALRDPNFDRTIVLVLDHDDEGALGIVLNRPGTVDVAEALPAWSGRVGTPGVVFRGGPVADGVAIGIGVVRAGARQEVPPGDAHRTAGWSPVVADLGIIDLAYDPGAADALDVVRIFSGYAGWAPGQLEGELAQGAWFVSEARTTDAVGERPHQLWRDVLRRQGGDLALLALYPADPSLN